jgi:hypothetical protein
LVVAQGAIPGDATYGIKRGSENLQLTLASSDAQKADICSRLMKRRANELATLPASTKNADKVISLTTAIKEEADEFSEYANKAGSNKARLQVQRTRDAQYVLQVLKDSQSQQTDSSSQRAIAKTTAAMAAIVTQS